MKKIIILTAIVFLACAGLSFAAQKSMTKYMRAGNMAASLTGSSGGGDIKSKDFVTNDPVGGAITGSIANNNLNMGNDKNDASGSYIYGGDSVLGYCVDGKCVFGIGLRVYFEFTFKDQDASTDSKTYADGLTFFVINGSNNNKNSTGGSPTTTSMGELLGYGGPGRIDGLGLQPPKMGIEFDNYPNPGTGDVCSSDTRNDAADNHVALMFWGDDLTGTCTMTYGGNTYTYPKSSFDDNRHGAGGSGGYPPVNSYIGDGTGGYYSTAKGTYNWLEDNTLHRFRMEIARNTVPETSGTYINKYKYIIKAWVDCGYNSNTTTGCPTDQLTAFTDLTNPYSLTSQINRTVYLTAADHALFDKILFGFGFATGGAHDTISLQNFAVYFPRNNCGYGTYPSNASPDSTAHTSQQITVYATSGCQWTAVSDQQSSWLPITSGSPGTGNGTVTYNVSANTTGIPRTGNITIGDSITSLIFKVNQTAAQTIGAITFTPSTLTLVSNTTASATATSGLAVTFTSLTTGVCTVSGTNGSTVTGVALGTCTIAANQAGNAYYEAAPQVTGTIMVTKADQATLTVSATTPLAYLASETLSSTGGSGTGVVTYSTTGSCTVSGTTLTATSGTGTCNVTATKAADATYNAATSAAVVVTLSKVSQTISAITFNPATLVVGGTTTASATATSGLAVTFTSLTTGVCTVSGTNGSTVTAVAAGTCTIAANQAGNANYNAATQVTGSITVNKANQTIGAITFTPTTLRVGGTTTASATATSGLAVTFTSLTTGVCTVSGTNGSTVTGVAAGTCTIAANQAGNANYNAAPQVTNSLTVTCTLTIANNSFACKSSTASNRIYIKVYLTDGAGNPVTDATVTYKIDSGTSTTLTNSGGGYYGGTQTSTCGALYGSTANCARTTAVTGSHTVSVTATRTGCTGSPLTKTMTVP